MLGKGNMQQQWHGLACSHKQFRHDVPGADAADGPPDAGPLRGAAPEGAMAVVPLSLSIGCASACEQSNKSVLVWRQHEASHQIAVCHPGTMHRQILC